MKMTGSEEKRWSNNSMTVDQSNTEKMMAWIICGRKGKGIGEMIGNSSLEIIKVDEFDLWSKIA